MFVCMMPPRLPATAAASPAAAQLVRAADAANAPARLRALRGRLVNASAPGEILVALRDVLALAGAAPATVHAQEITALRSIVLSVQQREASGDGHAANAAAIDEVFVQLEAACTARFQHLLSEKAALADQDAARHQALNSTMETVSRLSTNVDAAEMHLHAARLAEHTAQLAIDSADAELKWSLQQLDVTRRKLQALGKWGCDLQRRKAAVDQQLLIGNKRSSSSEVVLFGTNVKAAATTDQEALRVSKKQRTCHLLFREGLERFFGYNGRVCDESSGRCLIEAAAQHGSRPAAAHLAFMQAHEAAGNADLSLDPPLKAIHLLEAQRQAGSDGNGGVSFEDGHVLCLLGMCYQYGWGFPSNLGKAYTCFDRSALLGDVNGMLKKAYCLQHGVGVVSNPAAGFSIIEEACNLCSFEAWAMKGTAYEFGRGVPCNLALAASCYDSAAAGGSALGEFKKAEWLLRFGTQRDTANEAIVCLEKSAGHAHTPFHDPSVAAYCLGELYEAGLPERLTPSLEKAQKWFTVAATTGSDCEDAQQRLSALSEQSERELNSDESSP